MASVQMMQTATAEEDLSDEQIEQLLQQAEARLRGQQPVLSLTQTNTPTTIAPKRSKAASLPAPAVSVNGHIAKARPDTLVNDEDRKLASQGFRKIEDPIAVKRRSAKNQKATAGAQWYDLPKTDLTPQLKRDLQVLRMRSVLDPHRHYKKDNSKSFVPEYSQVGTIVEGPTEFFSARVPKRERHKTFADGVMEGEKDSGRMKRKYGEIQDRKKSGKRGDYKRRMETRYRGKVKG